MRDKKNSIIAASAQAAANNNTAPLKAAPSTTEDGSAKMQKSESETSFLTPEEIAAEEARIKKHEEEVALAHKLKEQELQKFKSFASQQDAARSQEQKTLQEHKQAVESFKAQLKPNSEGVILEMWLNYQPPNTTQWHRRFAVIKNGSMSVYSDADKITPIFNSPLKGCKVTDAEEDTCMRNAFCLAMNNGTTYTFSADSRTMYFQTQAALEYCA